VFVLNEVLSRDTCAILEEVATTAFREVQNLVGLERLTAAGESGVVRSPMKYREEFLHLLVCEPVNALTDRLIGSSAICHLMNGILLAPDGGKADLRAPLFQGRLHRDFPRHLGGVPLSVNSFFCLSEFSPKTGSTRFLVGSHQHSDSAPPGRGEDATSVEAPAGSVIFFDSTIWHAGGRNSSGAVRAAVNVQWTFHWIKQQIDLVRHLGTDRVGGFPADVRRKLGWDSRVVTSLEEYYVAAEDRLYKSGQG
jgi:ectoine hydroxylase-related dioxygenase (phytanoyl-CoA dioxygenase family)